MNQRIKGILKYYIQPTVLCIGLAYALGATPWMQRLENVPLDLITQYRVRYQQPADSRVGIIGIDDSSIEDNAYGRWTWDRQIHGRFMESISHGKPSVLVWDILFTEKSADFKSDLIIQAGAHKLQKRVIFAAYTSGDDPQQPSPIPSSNLPITNIQGEQSRLPTSAFGVRPILGLQKAGLTAYVDTPPGNDGVRRSAPMLQRIDGKVYPSLSLQALMLFGNVAPAEVRVVLGEAIYLDGKSFRRRIPINHSGQYEINYRYALEGAKNAGNVFPYYDITESYHQNFVAKSPFPDLPEVSDKILIVGQIATGLSDMGVTPYGAETPLVLVHANVIDNILNEDYAIYIANWKVLIVTFAVGLSGLLILSKKSLKRKAVFALGVPAIYLSVGFACWTLWSIWLPLIWPLVGFGSLQVFMIVRQLVNEQRAAQRIKGMFGTYVSPELVKRMINSGQSPELGGHQEEITAYFSDIQGFSGFSEKLSPAQLVVLMNEYLSACTNIIQEEGGTLDKYIGDAVVAMFGAPLPLPDHALRACVASQRIHLKLLELREIWKSHGHTWPQIVIEMQSRIGLNSGPVIVGNMGSTTRFNYTMMGDNVNLAARMESGAKSWGVYSMCTDATKNACESHGGDRVVFRALGRIVVRGRSTAVPIFEIVGLKENVSEKTRGCLRIFEQALALHYQRDWDGSLSLFRQSASLEPNQPGVTVGVTSNPSLIYIDIVQRYQVSPPPADWDGEYVMSVK
jgi:adenylate cyclase